MSQRSTSRVSLTVLFHVNEYCHVGKTSNLVDKFWTFCTNVSSNLINNIHHSFYYAVTTIHTFLLTTCSPTRCKTSHKNYRRNSLVCVAQIFVLTRYHSLRLLLVYSILFIQSDPVLMHKSNINLITGLLEIKQATSVAEFACCVSQR